MLQDLCQIALSINFNKSDDCESADIPSSPGRKTQITDGYKCFKCYGTGIKNCKVCLGTETVSYANPLTKLLNSVLLKKLNLGKQCCQKEEQQLQKVYPITEQQEDTDEKRLVCSYCSSECDEVRYYCRQCPKFNICHGCQNKTISHEHQICGNILSSCKVDINIGQENKTCFSCQSTIQNCYSVCRTCKDQGIDYWICDVCSDNKHYCHQQTHILQTVIDYQAFKDNNIETISQQFEQDQDKSAELSEQKTMQLEQCEHIFLNKKNSSIANYLELMERGDDSPLLMCNKSTDVNKKNDYTSRVRFQLDGLFSSYQFSSETKSVSKNMLCPPAMGAVESRFSCNKSATSKSNQKQNQYECNQYSDFAFTGYRCDICNVEPIKNVRYHCTQCEDFDVCKNCYDYSLKCHQHITFDRIDHKEIRQQALQRLFQNKDTNLRTSINLTLRNNLTLRKTTRSRTVRFPSEY